MDKRTGKLKRQGKEQEKKNRETDKNIIEMKQNVKYSSCLTIQGIQEFFRVPVNVYVINFVKFSNNIIIICRLKQSKD